MSQAIREAMRPGITSLNIAGIKEYRRGTAESCVQPVLELWEEVIVYESRPIVGTPVT
jgi:hypothetical protein